MKKLALRGKFTVQHYREGKLLETYEFPNGIVDEGLEHCLDITFGGGSQETLWYIGLIDNSGFSALAAANTMSSHAGWTELTAYDEAARQQWTLGAASSRSVTNSTTVDFTMNATDAVYGIFIVSDNTRGGSSGTLWSTAAFTSVVHVVSADVLKITYTLSG